MTSAMLKAAGLPVVALCLVAGAAHAYEVVPVSGRRQDRRQGVLPGHRPGQEDHSHQGQGSLRRSARRAADARRRRQGRAGRGRLPEGQSPKGKAWGPADKTPVLDQEKCIFKPAVQVMRAGKIDIVELRPRAAQHARLLRQAHRVQPRAARQGHDASRATCRGPGLVRVECDAHGWMLAHIYVADSPYYALTGTDGSFSITDVPPGNYTLVASQYFPVTPRSPVTVKAGETAKLAIELKKQVGHDERAANQPLPSGSPRGGQPDERS